ncbi:TPA: hypothetical protein ACH3X2_013731 [Trebouxia sp. C0005]
MDRALAMHDNCLRSVLHRHHGYEVGLENIKQTALLKKLTRLLSDKSAWDMICSGIWQAYSLVSTEGDAFTMAFHDPIDAISWALEVQHKLLLLDWPDALLSHNDAKEECAPGTAPITQTAVIFRGLRVRMAVHTGTPDALQVHHVTRQVEYRGDVVSLTDALVGFPAGGQVLISGSTYQRVYGRLHTVKFDNQLPGQTPHEDTAAPAVSRPGISFNTRFNAVLDPTPSAGSNLDLATEGSNIDLLLRTNSATSAVGILQQSESLDSPTSHAGVNSSAWTSDAPANPETRLMQRVREVSEAPRRVWRFVGRLGMQLMPCVFRKHLAEVKREGSFFRKWKPSQTDVNGMVNSTMAETGAMPCVLCDMGAFHLAEFADTLCRPFVGSAVHGGIHILQIGSMKLHPRMLTFPTLNSTFKVAPTFGDAPGVTSSKLPVVQMRSPTSKLSAFHPQPALPAGPEWPEVTTVFCGPAQYKELMQQDVHAADSALRHFQSCVRTTLLLSNGYECQEKVGLVHGKMQKICPHFSTGRADYFGSTVNRAARLLVAANAGQILVEAPVMEAVLKQWNGDAFNLAPVPKGHSLGAPAKPTRGAALVESVSFVLPELAEGSPRIKSAPLPNSLASLQNSDGDVATGGITLQLKDEASLPPLDLPLQHDQVGRTDGSRESRGWAPLSPGLDVRSIRPVSSNPGAHEKCNTVTFAPTFKERRPIIRMPSVSAVAKGRSIDGQVSYDDSELMQLEFLDACCPPHAAASSLAVSNCHMLKFMAASGIMQGRREDVVAPHRLSILQQALSVSTGNTPHATQDSHGSLPVVSRLRSDSSISTGASRRPSLLGRSDSKLTVVTEAKPRESTSVRAVWTPSVSEGKPFPAKRVPIEVWGIGAFKFKGIQGVSKVMEVQPADLAERIQLQSKTLEPGKATCVLSAHYLRCSLSIQLMDVLDLQLSL